MVCFTPFDSALAEVLSGLHWHTFTVPGIPKTAGSKRAIPQFSAGKWQRNVIVDDSGAAGGDWRGDLRAIAIDYMNAISMNACFEGSMALVIEFVLPRPKAHYKSNGELKDTAPVFKVSKPDSCKMLRSAEDALKGILWTDDSVIVFHMMTKVYCRGDERPGATLRFACMEDADMSELKDSQ